MRVLAFEASCDEASVAVAKFNDLTSFQIEAELISSQVELHQLYGGVVPELASREHLANLPLLIDLALRDANCDLKAIDGLVVTAGPGLHGCLLVGLSLAKGLALSRGLPFIGVNHIEGHVHAAMMESPALKYPFVALVVSGGHTELIEVLSLGEYRVLARTLDDAAGEAFDKAASLIGLPYPGGPKLALLADKTGTSRYSLPRVMRGSLGFSFSGLKTAIAQLVERERPKLEAAPELLGEIAYAVQDSIIDALVFKLREALTTVSHRRVVLTGGVAANHALRRALKSITEIDLYMPSGQHCTDNAAMIAYIGAARMMRGERSDLRLDARSRWHIEELSL